MARDSEAIGPLVCPECQSTDFVVRQSWRLWEEAEVSSEDDKPAKSKVIEREYIDANGWDGIFCAHCGEDVETEDNWEQLDAVWDRVE